MTPVSLTTIDPLVTDPERRSRPIGTRAAMEDLSC